MQHSQCNFPEVANLSEQVQEPDQKGTGQYDLPWMTFLNTVFENVIQGLWTGGVEE